MPQAHVHHFVPQWYQRRFLLPGQQHFYYLDLKPGIVQRGDAKIPRRSILRWGPKRCFHQEDLYTFGPRGWTTDEIERRFFGPIDAHGRDAVAFFTDYRMDDKTGDAYNDMILYMDAQRSRTPRALDWLKHAMSLRTRSMTLVAMQRTFQMHKTMWAEGIWEIVSAARSPTKFIVTDEPVTFYNARRFPGSPTCRYPFDVNLGELGTRTIFPLGMDACLLITHMQLTRDPWADHTRLRTNARAFQSTMVNLLDIQSGREIEEDEVLRINFILKQRASRHLAAAEEEWLYPERRLSKQLWSKLDEDWFLLPHLYKVKFSGGIAVGYKDGTSWAMDEYGRPRTHPKYQDKSNHDHEWRAHLRAQKEWAMKRVGKSRAHVHEFNHDAAYDRMADDDIKRQRAGGSQAAEE